MYSFLTGLLSFSEPPEGRIAAATDHFVFITSDGVYSCGAGVFGQLGYTDYENNEVHQPIPVKITFPADAGPIKQVGAVRNGSGFLTESGQVYVSGSTYEMLTFAACSDHEIYKPRRVEFPEIIHRMYFKEYFFIGENENHYYSHRVQYFHIDELFSGIGSVIQLGTSQRAIFFLIDNGDVYMLRFPVFYTKMPDHYEDLLSSLGEDIDWFIGDDTDLLTGEDMDPLPDLDNDETPPRPIKINFPPDTGPIIQIICEWKFASFLTKSGKVYTLNIDLDLDTSSGTMVAKDRHPLTPTLVEIPESVKQISCKQYWMTFLTYSGQVYIFKGDPHDSDLFPSPTKLELPKPIREVSCGVGFVVLLTYSNEVYFYGKLDYLHEDYFGEDGPDFSIEKSVPTKIFP
jgi:hypothetical protein